MMAKRFPILAEHGGYCLVLVAPRVYEIWAGIAVKRCLGRYQGLQAAQRAWRQWA